jgi:hypothetical protein
LMDSFKTIFVVVNLGNCIAFGWLLSRLDSWVVIVSF